MPLTAPIRFAILGCGRMGRKHAERLQADGRGIVVAVFDTEPAAVETLRHDRSLDVPGFTNLHDLLHEATADAAIVCTPTARHFEHVQACRSRGWHVLCEKPLADRREHIQALIDRCRGAGPVLSIAYQRRYWPAYRVLRQEFASGRWGAVRGVTSINAECWQPTITGTWRDDPAQNLGGFLGDAGSHKIDAAFYVTGLEPLDVFARSQTCGSQVEIVTSVSARLTGDVPLTMHFHGNAHAFREDLHVHCQTADLLLRDWSLWLCRNNSVEPLKVADTRWQHAIGFCPFHHPELDRLGNPLSGFLDQLLLDAQPLVPPECALPVFDFTSAVLRSIRGGRIELV